MPLAQGVAAAAAAVQQPSANAMTSAASLDGRARRKLGKQKMVGSIQQLRQQISFMTMVIEEQQRQLDALECHASPELFDAACQTEVGLGYHLQVPGDQLECGHLSTASPAHFDAACQTEQTDHASPALFDAACQSEADLGPPLQVPSDQLQCGHLSAAKCDIGNHHASPVHFDLCDGDSVYLGADHASPVLTDASSQTSITILKTLPDFFFEIGVDGHPSPVFFDGDCAAGTSHGISFSAANSEVAVEVDGPSPISGAHGDAEDVISFNAAISKVAVEVDGPNVISFSSTKGIGSVGSESVGCKSPLKDFNSQDLHSACEPTDSDVISFSAAISCDGEEVTAGAEQVTLPSHASPAVQTSVLFDANSTAGHASPASLSDSVSLKDFNSECDSGSVRIATAGHASQLACADFLHRAAMGGDDPSVHLTALELAFFDEYFRPINQAYEKALGCGDTSAVQQLMVSLAAAFHKHVYIHI